MADDGEKAQAVVPFRHRHDGWTAARQRQFVERLTETGCVRDACQAAGLSTTSAYRAYARMPRFAEAWDAALATRRPMLEDAAFERAIHGVAVPLTRLGQVVGERRRYSDTLLRFLIERGDRIAAERPPAAALYATAQDTDAAFAKRLCMIAERNRAEDRRRAVIEADRLRMEGKAP